MTPDELDELRAQIKAVGQLKKIFLIGLILALPMPVLVYINKNEVFELSMICFLDITFYFGYTYYWKPLANLKKDITLQISDLMSAKVSRTKGADKNIVVITRPKFKLTYYNLERFKIPVEKLTTNTMFRVKFARYSKYILNITLE